MTEYVTLVSRDGFEFKVLRSAANISGAIKRMLDPTSALHLPFTLRFTLAIQDRCADIVFTTDNFAEAKSNRCVFENINGVVLEKVCEYLYYNEKHKDAKDVPDMDVPPELCLELLMAADYLNG